MHNRCRLGYCNFAYINTFPKRLISNITTRITVIPTPKTSKLLPPFKIYNGTCRPERQKPSQPTFVSPPLRLAFCKWIPAADPALVLKRERPRPRRDGLVAVNRCFQLWRRYIGSSYFLSVQWFGEKFRKTLLCSFLRRFWKFDTTSVRFQSSSMF